MYEPTYWKDEVVENPYRYKETQNSDGSIEHVPYPGEVLQEGTEQSAKNFNHMEQGILEAHEMSAEVHLMIFPKDVLPMKNILIGLKTD